MVQYYKLIKVKKEALKYTAFVDIEKIYDD